MFSVTLNLIKFLLFSAVFQHYLANQQLVLCTSTSTSRACTILANSWKLKKTLTIILLGKICMPSLPSPTKIHSLPLQFPLSVLWSARGHGQNSLYSTGSICHPFRLIYHLITCSLVPTLIVSPVSLPVPTHFVVFSIFVFRSIPNVFAFISIRFYGFTFSFPNFQPLFSGLIVTSYFEGKNVRCSFFS